MEAIQNYIGIGVMVIGGLIALLGVLLLINHNGGAKIIIGIILAALGLGGVGVGYTLDQRVEVTYTVAGITQISARESNNEYRVTLRGEAGTETWIYVNDNQLYLFPESEQVTMSRAQLKVYRDQKTTQE